MKKTSFRRVLLTCALLLSVSGALAQSVSGLYIPSAKPMKEKDLKRAWVDPQTFCLLLQFVEGDSTYSVDDLDLLDSAYSRAFALEVPRFYTLTIEAYGDADTLLSQARAQSVYRYFAMRGHEVFPVRFAHNAIHCSCHGDSSELVRYEIPTSTMAYNCQQLPDSRRTFNQTIDLQGSVLITFRDNREECLGGTSGCFIPQQDSTVRAYYTQLTIKKGAIYSMLETKDDCPPPVTITIDEHLDCQKIVDKYFLVPHRRQIILPVGYVVLHSSFERKPMECELELPDSIMIRFPVTDEQIEGKLRIFAKKYSEKGAEFKSLNSKKIKNGPITHLQANINIGQFDTIYLAKRINEEEVSNYLYPADPQEQSAVQIGQKYYKPFRIGRNGEYEYKKMFRALLRLMEEEEEINDQPEQNKRGKVDNDEEID